MRGFAAAFATPWGQADVHGCDSGAAANEGGGTTTSYLDLAAAFGNGLAESMDDAANGNGGMLSDSFFNQNEDLNLARMRRYTQLRGNAPAGAGGTSARKRMQRSYEQFASAMLLSRGGAA